MIDPNAKVRQMHKNMAQHGLVDAQLNSVKRWNLQWCLLCLAAPFYALVGMDAFSHLRIHNVADGIIKFSEENKSNLNTDSKYIIAEMLETLVKKIEKKGQGSSNTQTIRKIRDVKDLLFPAIKIREEAITDGYGEFIVVNPRGYVDRRTYEAAHKIFLQYRDEKDRVEHIQRELKKIDTNLHAVFIPRTLYELTFVKDQLQNTANGSQKYKMPCFDGVGDNNDERVKNIAYGINEVLEREFKAINKADDSAFSGNQISSLLEDKISYLTSCISSEKEISRLQDGCRTSRLAFAFTNAQVASLWTERRKQIVRNMTALECSQAAQHSYVLCRGSRYLNDSVVLDKGSSRLSFGTGLFPGVEHDHGATAFSYMGSCYNKTKDAYAIIVPKEKASSSPFYIPKTHAICQLSARGEDFHARTMDPKDIVASVSSNIAGVFFSKNSEAKSTLSLQELDESFSEYKSKSVPLAPPIG